MNLLLQSGIRKLSPCGEHHLVSEHGAKAPLLDLTNFNIRKGK